MPGDPLWSLLRNVAAFDLVIRHHSTRVLLHRGAGRIRVESTRDLVTWHEQGEWTTGRLAGIRFSNTTRWRWIAPGALGLSYQRRGAEPVVLSTLRQTSAGQWIGTPHLCKADCYSPVLVPAADHLMLGWDVTSPTDPYRWEMRAE